MARLDRICATAILAFVLVPLVAPNAAAREPLVITSVEQVHQVPASDLAKKPPVDMECVVLCSEPDWPILFVSDGTHGMYAGNVRFEAFKHGDRVRLRGSLGEHRFPIDLTIEPSNSHVAMPAPKVVDFEHLQAGHEDSQLVAIQGQLVGFDTERFQTCLEMKSSTGGRFRGLIHASRVDARTLRGMLGKRLRLQGVVGARFDDSQRWSGFQIWLSDPSNIMELEHPGESLELPITPIRQLTAEKIVATGTSFFRTAGLATYRLSDSMFLLQDNHAQLFVELQAPDPVNLDGAYDVLGSLDTSVSPPVFRMATASPVVKAFEPQRNSSRLTVDELAAGDFSGQLVRTTGTYAGPFDLQDQHGFLLRSKNSLLPVFLEDGKISEIAPGTNVEVEGIWIQQKSLVGFNIGSCALHARGSGIAVGSQTPWLLLSVLGIAGTVSLGTTLWAVTLRSLVQRRTQQRAEIEQRMLAMQKMESLGVLAGGIAHDFNNLLTVIVGNASLMAMSSTLTTNDRESLTSIQQASARAAELTQQMLAYAGRGRFDTHVLDVSQLVSELSQLLCASIPKNLKLTLDLSGSLPGVKADATQLRQILMNLVRNAAEAMAGRDGAVHIKTYSVKQLPRTEADTYVVHFVEASAASGPFVCLEVRDEGMGIDAANLRRIFDPFFSTKFSGRGLGLALVFGIVRGHKGGLAVRSQTGQGATFRVYLSACDEPAKLPRPSTSPSPNLYIAARVLIVDDEPEVLNAMARTLETAGLQVTRCTSGEEAMRILNQSPTAFACLVTDQTMPDMSGLELCQSIRKQGIDLPTILISGYSADLISGSQNTQCFQAFLQKPYIPNDLIEQVHKAISTRPDALGQSPPD